MSCAGRLVAIDDTELWVDERGPADGLPLIVIHGGPGVDHHVYGDYLDPLTDRGVRLVFFDLRGDGRSGPSDPATWTLERRAQDVIMLALALGLERYAVLGHSYGALVALQHAVDYPGTTVASVVSSGVPSARWLAGSDALETAEPDVLRDGLAEPWSMEGPGAAPSDVVEAYHRQLPLRFADPLDPRIDAFIERTDGLIGSPDVVERSTDGPGIDLEDRLLDVPHPVTLLTGRHDRSCPAIASEYMAKLLPNATLHVFEDAGHMTYVEATERYLDAVAGSLARLDR